MRSKNKKILLIRNSHGFGGAEVYVCNLAVALKGLGYEPIVVTNVPKILKDCRSNGVKSFRGPWYAKQGWGRIYYLLRPAITAWYMWIIAWYRIDVVHPQGIDDFVFATSAARLMNRKAIWTDHGDAKYFMRSVSSPRLRALALKSAKYAAAVVVVSQSEKEEILTVAPDFPNITVIHNGVFVREFSVQKQPNTRPLVIGCTSRLIKTKGIGELIEAFSNLKQTEKLELWLIGTGEDQDKFMSKTKQLGVQSRVKFLGFQEDVWRYLEAFDIYAHPSYHEAFSIALIEAAMAGKPTIATRVGGNPEIVNENTGILVEPKDVDSLKEGLQKLIDDPVLRKRFGNAARKVAVEKYDFDKIVAEKMVPLYE